MKRSLLACMFVMATLLLGSCRISLGLPDREHSLPTIGPLQRISGRTGVLTRELSTNTNCAEVGDLITFTGTITHEATYPLRITTLPLVDFVISPANWRVEKGAEPIQRWSQTSLYPPNINPILAPGEQRIYRWEWKADTLYGQFGVNGVRTRFVLGDVQLQGSVIPEGGDEVWVGVRTMPGGESSESGMKCADIQRH